jgi:hypothetical protein
VVGFGLGGDERHPPEPFAAAFAIAADAGLLRVPHAGELAGPDSVRAALDALGADRVQHGVRALATSATPTSECHRHAAYRPIRPDTRLAQAATPWFAAFGSRAGRQIAPEWQHAPRKAMLSPSQSPQTERRWQHSNPASVSRGRVRPKTPGG